MQPVLGGFDEQRVAASSPWRDLPERCGRGLGIKINATVDQNGLPGRSMLTAGHGSIRSRSAVAGRAPSHHVGAHRCYAADTRLPLILAAGQAKGISERSPSALTNSPEISSRTGRQQIGWTIRIFMIVLVGRASARCLSRDHECLGLPGLKRSSNWARIRVGLAIPKL